MKYRPVIRLGVLLTALVLMLASCESLKFSMMKDDELVKGGIQAWNSDKASAARAYWNAIKDPTLKAQWLGRFDQLDHDIDVVNLTLERDHGQDRALHRVQVGYVLLGPLIVVPERRIAHLGFQRLYLPAFLVDVKETSRGVRRAS